MGVRHRLVRGVAGFGGTVVARGQRPATSRVDAWSRGIRSIRDTVTCGGRVTAHPIASATSSATSGVTPA